MPYKDKVKERACWRRYYNRNRLDRRAALKADLEKKRRLIREAKTQPCTDCNGVFDPVCMDFDHRDGMIKVAEVSQMPRIGYGVKTIKIEMKKCDVVCANCHRLRTKFRLSEKDSV